MNSAPRFIPLRSPTSRHSMVGIKLRCPLRFFLLTCALFAGTAAGRAASGGSKPNILRLIAEDASRDFGCYGVEAARTPNIDPLARESCLDRNAFATGPVCSASPSAFMTGLYQTRIGDPLETNNLAGNAGMRETEFDLRTRLLSWLINRQETDQIQDRWLLGENK